jgi:GxxExxY protein
MDARIEEAANKLIGAAIEVHRHLGPGYLEGVYEQALAVELTLREIPFAKQVVFGLDYKGHVVGEGRWDFIVDDCLIVELKAVEALAPIHTAQCISYLKAGQRRLALLINFNVTVLKDGIKRVAL